jgi:multidrug efflux pump subunit AcrA (membrane-fusion protein)
MSTPISDSNQFNAWIRSALFTVTSLAAAVAQVQHLAAQDGPIQVPRVTITLVHQCDIPARDAGMLADITIREGQAVTKSTVVAILENEQQTLNLKAAELNVRVAEMKANNELAITAAKTQLQEAKSGRRVKEVGLEIATAEADSDIAMQVAAADTKLRELELERAENARESFKGSISASQLDRLKTAVEKGQLEIQQARDEHRVRKLKPQAEQAAIQQTDEQVRRYETLVQQEQKSLAVAKVTHEIHTNDLAMAQLKLEQRNIRAPFDGVIAKVERQVGEWVEPGAPVARIIGLKTLRAEGFLPAQQGLTELVGKPVRIQLSSSSPGEMIRGKVTFISSEIDPINMQVRFYAEFDNADLAALPGMSGSLIID